MQFYFIRHGQSENNALYARTGSWEGRSEDPELTGLGRQQAERLARFLAAPPAMTPAVRFDAQNLGGFGITHLYCSLMVRAVATGTAVARALGLPLVAWPDVHELGGIHQKAPVGSGAHVLPDAIPGLPGEPSGLPGRNRAYFEQHYPDLVLPDRLGEEGWWSRPFEGYEERLPRAQRFWRELLARHGDSDDRVAVVSHGGFYGHVLTAALDMPEGTWFSLNNVGISRIDMGEERMVVQYLNRLDFMPREMVT